MDFKQGKKWAAEYALEFRTLVAENDWNEYALKAAFCQGWNLDLLTKLACYDDQVSLKLLIEMNIHLDYLIQDRQLVKGRDPHHQCHGCCTFIYNTLDTGVLLKKVGMAYLSDT